MRVTILWLMTAVALTLNSAVADDDLDEASSVAKIEVLGGNVTRDESLAGRPVIGVDFQGSTKFNDKFIRLLAGFTNLTSINFTGCKRITDEGIAELSRLQGRTKFTRLVVSGTKITDAGVEQIAKLENL